MSQINLLPKEKRSGKSTTKLKKSFEISLTVMILVFLIALTTAFISTIYLNNKLEDLDTQLKTVENEVKDLSQVEDKTVFLRDRIEKFNLLKGENSEIFTIQDFEDLSSDFPDDVEFGELLVKDSNIEFQIQIRSLQSLSYILDLLMKSEKYDKLVVNNLSVTDEDYRYVMSLSIQGS